MIHTGVPKSSLGEFLFGPPLKTDDASHQTISKKVGLAVFASDAMSSVAYATQEILIVLFLAGSAALTLSLPIAAAITMLLAILTISYRQTIHAYPNGGGAYIVARDNLGEIPAMVAAAALLVDYILTVAVSISSSVEQIISAVPTLLPLKVEIAVIMVIIMTIINLRGVRESGRVFAIPTYFFVLMMVVTLGVGFFQMVTGQLGQVTGAEPYEHLPEQLSLLLILRAFSSGCTALTGVEAISNGVTAFQPPKSRNAANTLTVMAVILAVMFLGVTLLARQAGAIPSETETVISQISRTILGRGFLYALVISATMVILMMAANTSFNGFPRLGALAAADGFLPRHLTFRSGRLVFKWGIVLLAVAASALIIVFNASVTGLIPLYAIGVFLSFTLSQTGMVMRWRRISRLKPGEEGATKHSTLQSDRHWRIKQLINGVGAVVSFVVMCVFAYTKFPHGAWITVIVIPALVYGFSRIRAHYRTVADTLTFRGTQPCRLVTHPMRTIVLLDDVHRGTLRLVEFAKSLGHPWVAVHVDYDDRNTIEVKRKWKERIGEGELIILKSPYRQLIKPVRDFVLSERAKSPNGFVHVIMGQLVMHSSVERALHSNNALGLMAELQHYDRVIVTDVPYQLYAPTNGNGTAHAAHASTANPTPSAALPPAMPPPAALPPAVTPPNDVPDQ